MAVPLRLPAVTSVRCRHTAADLMVGLHLHLHMAEDGRPRMEEGSAVAGLQLRPTEVERLLTAAEVAAGRCLCHRMVVAVTPVVAVARADSVGEVGAMYPQGAVRIMVVAGVTGTAKLIPKSSAECKMPLSGGILF
jgi:hypothetical protein